MIAGCFASSVRVPPGRRVFCSFSTVAGATNEPLMICLQTLLPRPDSSITHLISAPGYRRLSLSFALKMFWMSWRMCWCSASVTWPTPAILTRGLGGIVGLSYYQLRPKSALRGGETPPAAAAAAGAKAPLRCHYH